MYRWFESRLDPFPATEPEEPPKTLVAFCLHFTKGAWPYLVPSALLMSGIAVTEVWMFSFLGNIVDWLAARDRATFLHDEAWHLAGMGLVVLVALPTMVWFHSLHQPADRSWATTPCASAGRCTATCSSSR